MATWIKMADFRRHEARHEGFCITCRVFTRDRCEPNASEYPCPDCNEKTVYGVEEAILRGFIVVDTGREHDEAHWDARNAPR